MADVKQIREAKEAWEKGPVAKTTARFPERKEEFSTLSSMPVERLYTPLNTEDVDYLKDVGFPGQYPFTRGVQPTMYRGR
ncbi:MAG: methylmalonyl-CoA mutase, partial [Firmicutes bacterium]|nr:methylmalonyl-CoA mutase [Bacillota bacterium]